MQLLTSISSWGIRCRSGNKLSRKNDYRFYTTDSMQINRVNDNFKQKSRNV